MATTSPGDEPFDPHGWVAEDVQGRGQPGGKGLAAVHSMTAQGQDGRQMAVERLDRGFGQVHFRLLAVATRVDFDRCPICLSPAPTSEEHVPPESLGGTKMTLTCTSCNNGFGSRLEADLLDWWEDAHSLVRFEHDDVQGARRVARVLLRQTPAGEPVVLADRPDPAFSDAMAPGTNFTMHIRSPERVRWRLGAIKSAFLGACLLLHEIPQSPEADAIRSDLLAARDAPRSATLAESDHCASLTVHKTQGPAVPGEIALVQIQPEEGGTPQMYVSLARTLIVSWPLGGHFVAGDALAEAK